MSWINACHASAAQDTLLFLTRREPLRLPPSLAPVPSTHCFRTAAERIRPRFPSRAAANQQQHPFALFFSFWRKSIVSNEVKATRCHILLWPGRGRVSVERQGKCEAALRGRVNFWMHIPHRDPQDGVNSQRCYLASRTHSGIWGCSLSPLNSLKRCRSEEA